MKRFETRLSKLERMNPANKKTWISLIGDRSQTDQELFDASYYQGVLADYNIWRVKIVGPPTISTLK